jgi:hypothetical protein
MDRFLWVVQTNTLRSYCKRMNEIKQVLIAHASFVKMTDVAFMPSLDSNPRNQTFWHCAVELGSSLQLNSLQIWPHLIFHKQKEKGFSKPKVEFLSKRLISIMNCLIKEIISEEMRFNDKSQFDEVALTINCHPRRRLMIAGQPQIK